MLATYLKLVSGVKPVELVWSLALLGSVECLNPIAIKSLWHDHAMLIREDIIVRLRVVANSFDCVRGCCSLLLFAKRNVFSLL